MGDLLGWGRRVNESRCGGVDGSIWKGTLVTGGCKGGGGEPVVNEGLSCP